MLSVRGLGLGTLLPVAMLCGQNARGGCCSCCCPVARPVYGAAWALRESEACVEAQQSRGGRAAVGRTQEPGEGACSAPL